MPQLIAMVIVVVGAMIYMFQTFGGTGDKIEGVAQKSVIITEINNVKTGIRVMADLRRGDLGGIFTDDTLEHLAEEEVFPEQMNELLDTTDDQSNNTYQAISFGAGDVEMSLVTNIDGRIPGIYVNLRNGNLLDNAAFLERQIAIDLASIATIDRHAVAATAAAGTIGANGIDARIPAATAESQVDGRSSDSDGRFIVYFRDIPLSGTTRARP